MRYNLTKKNEKIIVGIDIGTINSRVAYLQNHLPHQIINSEGHQTFPSVIAFNKKGKLILGTKARTATDKVSLFMHNLLSKESIKRGQATYSATYQLATYLQYLKYETEKYLKSQIERAVITVPDYFGDNEISILVDACNIIHLKVEGFIKESKAILISHGLNHLVGEVFLVCDFGNNFNISVIGIEEGGIEIMSSKCLKNMGDEFTKRIERVIVNDVLSKWGVNLSNNSLAMSRIYQAAEAAKIELSTKEETYIHIPFLFSTKSGPKHFKYRFTRSMFEEITTDLIQQIQNSMQSVVSESGIIGYLNQVVPAGASCHMPSIAKILNEYLEKTCLFYDNPELNIVNGAVIYGSTIINSTANSDIYYQIYRNTAEQ